MPQSWGECIAALESARLLGSEAAFCLLRYRNAALSDPGWDDLITYCRKKFEEDNKREILFVSNVIEVYQPSLYRKHHASFTFCFCQSPSDPEVQDACFISSGYT